MKKVWVLSVFLVICVFLSACKPNEKAQAYIDEGNAYMEKEDFDNAAVSYGEAINLDNKPAVYDLLTEARTSQLGVLQDKYDKAYEKANFKDAQTINKRIQKEFVDLLSKEEKKSLKDEAKELEDYIYSQDLYDNYLLWAKPYIIQLKDSSNKFSSIKISINLGGTSYASIDASLVNLIKEADTVAGAADTKAENVDPSLAKINNKLSSVARSFRDNYSAVLGAIRQSSTKQEILDSSEVIQTTTDDLMSAISELRSYAETKGIKDNYQKVTVSKGKATLPK